MLESVKDVLTKDIEVEKLRKVLESEVRLKEFLLHEVEVKNLFTKNNKQQTSDEIYDKHKSEKIIKELMQKYDKGLIGSLKNDHKELLFVYD